MTPDPVTQAHADAAAMTPLAPDGHRWARGGFEFRNGVAFDRWFCFCSNPDRTHRNNTQGHMVTIPRPGEPA